MLYINSTWEIRNRKLLLLHIKTKKKKVFFLWFKWFSLSFLCLFYDRLVSPCIQCLLIGTRWLQSLWSIVLGVIVQPFLTSAGKCCGGFSIHLAKEWDSHVRSTSRLQMLIDMDKCTYCCVSRGPKPSRHFIKYFIQNVTPIIYSYY